MDLIAQTRELVDQELIAAYWESVQHYGTTDLVLYLDTEAEVDPLRVFVRESLVNDPKAPPELTSKVTRPAIETAKELKGASTAFWLLAAFPGELVCISVIAERLGAGGSA